MIIASLLHTLSVTSWKPRRVVITPECLERIPWVRSASFIRSIIFIPNTFIINNDLSYIFLLTTELHCFLALSPLRLKSTDPFRLSLSVQSFPWYYVPLPVQGCPGSFQ